jgi:hypothetical protein
MSKNKMILKKHLKIKRVPINILIIIGAWMILHIGVNTLIDSNAIPGLKTASAGLQYGIQGKVAPELNLTTWIDGDGKPIDPINLSDYRNKVIYLYFFQDW